MPKNPLPLDVLPQPRLGMSKAEIIQSTAHWHVDDHETALDWSEYSRVWAWQGLPGDYAWLIKHAFGFPGRVVPQFFREDGDQIDIVVFRIGPRYFRFARGDDSHFQTWPLSEHPGRYGPRFLEHLAARQITTRRTAITALHAYYRGRSEELHAREPPLNRWDELKERGGYVQWQNMAVLRLYVALFE
uniref:Uncharacterized protein n=1 Tax=Mycena chlorophos TaxID=658473 RepID=A0ABQ0LUT3_MYCCL|nr:predicted protein [Mycena chlorophos]